MAHFARTLEPSFDNMVLIDMVMKEDSTIYVFQDLGSLKVDLMSMNWIVLEPSDLSTTEVSKTEDDASASELFSSNKAREEPAPVCVSLESLLESVKDDDRFVNFRDLTPAKMDQYQACSIRMLSLPEQVYFRQSFQSTCGNCPF